MGVKSASCVWSSTNSESGDFTMELQWITLCWIGVILYLNGESDFFCRNRTSWITESDLFGQGVIIWFPCNGPFNAYISNLDSCPDSVSVCTQPISRNILWTGLIVEIYRFGARIVLNVRFKRLHLKDTDNYSACVWYTHYKWILSGPNSACVWYTHYLGTIWISGQGGLQVLYYSVTSNPL